MTDDKLKAAPLAYQNELFLDSPDGRVLRILSEYIEPLARFRREQIQDTGVFFGSARFKDRHAAEHDLKEISRSPERKDPEALKLARSGVAMSRYYEDARRLASL